MVESSLEGARSRSRSPKIKGQGIDDAKGPDCEDHDPSKTTGRYQFKDTSGCTIILTGVEGEVTVSVDGEGAGPWQEFDKESRKYKAQLFAGIVPSESLPDLVVFLDTQAEIAERVRLEKEMAPVEVAPLAPYENSSGYFEPPVGYVFRSSSNEYSRLEGPHLGVGVFSVVWPVVDKNKKLIALKVVRKLERFRKAVEKEVVTLQKLKDLASKDEEGAFHICMMREHFVQDGTWLCLAFPKLSSSLRSAGRQSLQKTKAFGKQTLLALRYLHNSAGLVHCDVKPDNLLLRSDGLAVMLCDFGAARSWLELQGHEEVQALFYRAPEVIIGMMRGPQIDMWSAGCTLYEIATGRIIFETASTPRDVLKRIMELRGVLSERMREQGELTKSYFGLEGFLSTGGKPIGLSVFKQLPLLPDLAQYADVGQNKGLTKQEQAQMQLSKLIGGITMAGAAKRQAPGSAQASETEAQLELLSGLIEKCLDMDPSSRISAVDAVGHKIFGNVKAPPPLELEDAPQSV